MDQAPRKFQFTKRKRKLILRKVRDKFSFEDWKTVQPLFDEAYTEAIKGLKREDFRLLITNMAELCEACGICCHRSGNLITITDKDIQRILPLFQNIENLYDFFNFVNGQWRFKHLEVCAFLKNGKCSIYPYRPTACRIYPITEVNGQLTARFHKSCKIPINLIVHKIVKHLRVRLANITVG